MMSAVCRLCVWAKPTAQHRSFEQWETADVVVFVEGDTRDEAMALGRKALGREGWEILEIQLCDKLIENRIRNLGGEPLERFEAARRNGYAIKVFPRNFAAGKPGFSVQPPRITETFIDQIVLDIGGHRLPADDKHRTADYRIDDWVFDLKDLQEEGLLKPQRQTKIAALFSSHAVPGVPFQIDPLVLRSKDRRRFYDILSGPIQTQVKSASKQIRSTKQTLGDVGLRGGIIYLNTGYGTLPPDEFGPLVERYARKDTTQIEAFLCISTWVISNGFDSELFFNAYPSKSQFPVIARLQKAFGTRFEEAMTKLIRGQLPVSTVTASPLTPVVFSVDGLDYVWQPPSLPLPWARNQGSHA